MTGEETFVIVGASLTGAKAAETLRAEGFAGRLVLVGAEHERPYERPPLSKEYLRGEAGREKVYVHEEGFYAEQEIELRLGRTAVGWTRRERARARRRRAAALRPPAAGHRAPSRAGLRSRAASSTASPTCVASRTPTPCATRLAPAARVVVIGAGWIGCRGRGLGPPARVRGHGRRARVGAARARAGGRGRRDLPRHPRRSRRADAAGHRRRGVRGRDGGRARPHERRPHARLRPRGGRRRRRSRAPSSRPAPASPSRTASSSTRSCTPAARACSRPAT